MQWSNCIYICFKGTVDVISSDLPFQTVILIYNFILIIFLYLCNNEKNIADSKIQKFYILKMFSIVWHTNYFYREFS